MKNISKLLILVIAIFSLTAHSETIKEKADKGLFDRNLNISQTLAILGNRSDNTSGQHTNYRDNTIRVLLGDNATTKSYIKTPLSVEDTLTLLKGVYYRANLIAYLTNNKQIQTPLSVEQILQLIDGVGNRGWVITDLANKGLMPNKITPTQMGLLLGAQNNEWAVEAVRALTSKQLLQDDLNISQTLAILGNRSDNTSGQHTNYRDNTIRVLLGDNATTKSYIKTPLSVEDTLTLLKGVYYRANLIAYLTNNKQIQTPLSVEQILQLIDGVGNRGWVITDLANKGLMPNKITPTQMGLLLGAQNNEWAVEAVRALTSKQLLQDDLNISQTLAILGNRSDNTSGQHTNYRDNTIRVLLGDNATTKSYIKTPLSVEDTLTLLKGVYYRANLIAYLTNNKQIQTPLSVEQILQLIDGVGNRGWVITDLANKGLMPNKITPTQMGLLLGAQNNEWAVEAVRALTSKQLLQDDLNISQTLAILGNRSDNTSGQHTNYRDNTIRVLLGDNATTKSYIKTPLSVEDTLTLLKGVYYRANLIAYLTNNKQIQTPLSVEQILQLIDGVGNRGWVITDLANKGLMPNKITPTQMGLLLGAQNNEWAVEAVRALTSKQLLQDDLNISQTLAILGNRSDNTSGQHTNYRDNTIRVLLGDNATTKSYIKTPLSVEDTLTLLKGVYYRINLVKYVADYNLIQSGIREDSVINLTDSNDVKFTNQVIKILSGENLIKKNYFDQFVALSKEEIEKQVIKREFDVVVSTLQSKENFIVYLLKHGYITTEMTIDQVNGLLLSQPTSQRLKTFTDIVNSGLLVSILNRDDVDILIAAILGNNCDADTQQSKELITNTVIRLLEGNNSSSKVFFKSQTKDEVAEQEKIKAEVVEIVKVIQQVHFVDFDIVFEGNHWQLGQSAKRELDKLGAVLTSDVLVEGKFELVGHVSGTDGVDKVCIDSEHKYINDDSQAKECFKSQSEWSTVLSDRRAKTVKEYLIANYNISSERLKSYGVGHSQHKFKDDPDNAGNRRVEVRYIKK